MKLLIINIRLSIIAAFMLLATNIQAFQIALPLELVTIKILILGDSLTEGYGLNPENAYPMILENSLLQQGYHIKILNAGESGSTSAGGLSRLPWYWRQMPLIVVVALGANDGLRGQSTEAMANNLTKIIKYAQKRGAKVLLAGMQIPPNYGAAYTQAFADVYPKVAKATNVPLIPFLLEGVGGSRRLMQADGLHPNAAGHLIMADIVEKQLLKHFSYFLNSVKKR